VAYDTFPATDAFPADDIFPAGVLLIPVNASISLDLFAEVTTADGTRYKWNANEAPGSRPINLSYRSKIGEGFSDASLQLPRRIDLDYADLNLGDTVSIVGADGSIVYEGYVAAMPRELSDRHVIGVTLTGWMAHAKDRQFQEIYVDRDVGQWGDMPIERKAAHLTGGNSLGDFSYAADMGGLVCAFPNQALGTFTNSEAWYAAPPSVTISRVGYRGKATSLPAGWTQTFMAGDSRAAGSETYTPTLDDTLRSTSLTTARRYLAHTIASAGTAATPASGASVVLSKLAVYGSHGLTTHAGDSTEPDGLYLSDILKNVAQRYCPFLDTSGVQTNTYIVQHCAFRDPTFPYDAFLELNKYALWHLGVWDNKQLVYKPYDLTDYDWEIRTDDPGITFAPQGPSTDSLFNGIAVTYTDPLTGTSNRITPETTATLSDASSANPWTAHSRRHWDEITLSTPTFAAQAALLGAAALADRNRPKTPGTITATGYIRDRAGNPQPVSKVRAGDTIAVTNFNDVIRLIVEADYDDEQKTVSLSIDKPFALLDAYLDRLGNAIGARGLA
jgi:hypothetical protein